VSPRTTDNESPRPTEQLKPLEASFDRALESDGADADGDAGRIRTTWEWIPYADALYVRIEVTNGDHERAHLLDAYLLFDCHDLVVGVLRCLALPSDGNVDKGDAIAIGDSTLNMELLGCAGEDAASHDVQLDLAEDGSPGARCRGAMAQRRLRCSKFTREGKAVDAPPHSLAAELSGPAIRAIVRQFPLLRGVRNGADAEGRMCGRDFSVVIRSRGTPQTRRSVRPSYWVCIRGSAIGMQYRISHGYDTPVRVFFQWEHRVRIRLAREAGRS
jgi:hypothetical protein